MTAITDLVDVTLHVLDDAVLPAANWVLELLDAQEALEAITDTKVTMEDINSFQERVAKRFVSDLKSNISSCFASQDVVSCFSIFDSRRYQVSTLPTYLLMERMQSRYYLITMGQIGLLRQSWDLKFVRQL